jgi:hypothetical protein
MAKTENTNDADAIPVTKETPAPAVLLNMTTLAARLSATREAVARMVLDGGFKIDAQTAHGDPLFFETNVAALKEIWRIDCLRHGSASRCRKAGLL